jgi:hypothetical protein
MSEVPLQTQGEDSQRHTPRTESLVCVTFTHIGSTACWEPELTGSFKSTKFKWVDIRDSDE